LVSGSSNIGDEDEFGRGGMSELRGRNDPLAVQTQKRQQAFNAIDAMLESD
jgi:hypothetical protein